jgi:hypothetical protein
MCTLLRERICRSLNRDGVSDLKYSVGVVDIGGIEVMVVVLKLLQIGQTVNQ